MADAAGIGQKLIPRSEQHAFATDICSCRDKMPFLIEMEKKNESCRSSIGWLHVARPSDATGPSKIERDQTGREGGVWQLTYTARERESESASWLGFSDEKITRLDESIYL